MLYPPSMLGRLLTACVVLICSLASMPDGWAQSQSGSCTLRASVDLFSKPKGQGRRTRLNAGAVLEILGHTGNWYTVYTGSAEAYVAASAFARVCLPQPRAPAPHPKVAPDLVDIPLEPLPGAPAPAANPMPSLPSPSDLKDAPIAPTQPAPAPKTKQEEPPPPALKPKRLETLPPASYFDPGAPLIEQPVAPLNTWKTWETGLWIGGGVAVAASATLYGIYRAEASSAITQIMKYQSDANTYAATPDQSQSQTDNINGEFQGAKDKVSEVQALEISSIVTGTIGLAALATALSLHLWAPRSDSSDAGPMAMPVLHIGWGSFVLEGSF